MTPSNSSPAVTEIATASQPVRGVAVILVAAFLIGVMSVCVRVAAREMAAVQIVFFRFAGAFAVLVIAARGRGLRTPARRLPVLVLRSLLGTAAISLYFKGIEGAGAGLATLLHCTYPVHTTLFASLLIGERFGARVGFALLLNLIGAALVLGPAAHVGGATFEGALYATAASVLAGGAVTAARHLRRTEPALPITTAFMAIGMVVTAPSLLSGVPVITPVLAAALAGTVLCSAAGQMLLHHGLGFTTATQGSLAAATTVISAAILEAVFFGSSLGPVALLGGAILITAVAVAASRRS